MEGIILEIRVLRYFLEIAREENMTKAAERLHVSQPSLSRQMKELEAELGQKLFHRSNYSIHLTNEGMLLRKRAEDLLEMTDKIEAEFHSLDQMTGGEVFIGCAESYLIKYLANAVQSLYISHPHIRYHITSGNTAQVAEKLDKGLFDFAIIVEPPDLSRYNYLEIPGSDTWGAVLRYDHPLALKSNITVDDLIPYPIFSSEQSFDNDFPRWCGEKVDKLNFLASFNLANNAAVFAREGFGITLTFKNLVDTSNESDLVFRPLYPKLETKMYVIWKKYQVFTPAAELLLNELRNLLK